MFQYDEKGVENMLLRIAVCDDEAIHRLIIRDKLDAYAISNDIDYELDEFTNSKELMKMENIYDILFLDVQLEDGMNGIEVGKRLLQKGIDATIIITTSFEQYASEGYHLKAHRYLIKPIQQSNFNEAIVSCIKDFKKSNRKIEVKCAYENCFISINSIVYIESYAPSEESHKVLMAFVCIGLILCNIAVFFIYDKNLKKYELENQLRQAQEMQRLQASYYMQLEKSLNESRKQMHDFKNHITTLEYLHQGKENTKAVSYMQELQQQMKEQMNLASFKVKNAAFDVILYEQNKRCQELGITFEKQVLYDDLSFLSYMDTCTIFANALDNAVKACSEIKEGERKIELFLKRKKDMLNIVIKNTKQNQILESNNRFFTTKSNKEHHGFGIENIKMAVEKYHGLVSIEYTEDSFVLAVIIPIPV